MHQGNVVADHTVGLGQATRLSHAFARDVQLPAALPSSGRDPISSHWSHPSGRQASGSIVPRTTPGEMILCRGTFALCWPHGHVHFVCGPDVPVTKQPARRSARSTSRTRIAVAMRGI